MHHLTENRVSLVLPTYYGVDFDMLVLIKGKDGILLGGGCGRRKPKINV